MLLVPMLIHPGAEERERGRERPRWVIVGPAAVTGRHRRETRTMVEVDPLDLTIFVSEEVGLAG
jgi:hypothetical protein